ncbi:SPOR domain-containing protein [Ascidiimonas sp. W6]|uniref:HU domain-containing protein n=1 Tax=Ascidiimonas meishanensis TaxID=3128903 RepID=UPI0030EBB533
MRVENYISDLLYRYQCVTIPNFGAFLTHRKPSKVHETTNAFYPPSKVVSFNEQLHSNDGLLARYISDVENIPYEEAIKKLEKLVDFWKSQLTKNEDITLKNIGSFQYTEEGRIVFEPSYHLNYHTPSFGLSSFVSPSISREVLKEEVEKIEAKVPVLFTPERRAKRPYLKYAAIALVTLAIGATGYIFFQNYRDEQLQIAEDQAVERVEQTIQRATFFDTDPILLPSVHLNVVKESYKYHIVAGAFRIEANAERKVKQLQEKGYNAERIGMNRYGLHQVSYASFSDVPEALEFLRKIKRTDSPEAWLFVSETK